VPDFRSIAMLAGNPAFAAILSRSLQEAGYAVESFVSVEQLTRSLRVSPADVVILDADMPGAPAADIARGLRSHARLATGSFSIVALSRTGPTSHRPLLAAGIDAVLQKPVQPGELLHLMARLAPVETHAPIAIRSRTMVLGNSNVVPLFGRRAAG
jgi:DNA-binding response OmpR family regulator